MICAIQISASPASVAYLRCICVSSTRRTERITGTMRLCTNLYKLKSTLTNLCEAGVTTAALQLPVTLTAAESWVDGRLAAELPGVAAAVTVLPATEEPGVSATVSLAAPLTTSDRVLLSTTIGSPTAAAACDYTRHVQEKSKQVVKLVTHFVPTSGKNRGTFVAGSLSGGKIRLKAAESWGLGKN